MQKIYLIGFIWVAAFFSCLRASCQIRQLQQQLLKLTEHADSIINNLPPERLYIQFNKPDYIIGDTLWFKAYLFNAASHLLSSRSGVLHFDIATDSGRIVKQYLFMVRNGLCPGDINFDGKTYKPGNYIIRAYTQWMRNFGDDGFYYKEIRIAGANENGWLVKDKIDTSAAGRHLRARLSVSRLDDEPFGDSTLFTEVLNGRKTLYKQRVQTDKDGVLDFNFNLPADTRPSIVLENVGRNQKAVIPLNLNRPENTDVQFMPEGGTMIAGIPTKVGFKAIGEDGKGVDISGTIVDGEGKQFASFNSLYRGIGSFEFVPAINEKYTAKVRLPGGLIKDYPFPLPKLSGTALRIKDVTKSDSLNVTLSATTDSVQNSGVYFLIGRSRGVICYAGIVNLRNNGELKKTIAKKLFPTGIVHFLLLTPQGQPLNQRLVYIDHHDELRIDIEPDKAYYAAKDSITLRIKVADSTVQAIKGTFSMAVTDNARVKKDSLTNETILNRMLLTADLKGYVETPGYYSNRNPVSSQALDNLLLTQGWVSYEPLSPQPTYQPESEYAIKGKVTNLFNASVKKTNIMLFSSRPAILMDTLTDELGRFSFDRFPKVDTPVFVLQARNRHGKSFNVNVKVDETAPPEFRAPNMPAIAPWYVNSDTTLIRTVKNNILIRKLEEDIPGAHHLKEVKIIAHKTIKGSENLNGPGNADFVLDEKDMEAEGKKNLLQLFYEKIKGFHIASFSTPTGVLSVPEYFAAFTFEKEYIRHADASEWYYIFEKPAILVMDGVEASDAMPNFRFDDYRTLLATFSAEDVKGIEINFNPRFNGNYLKHGKWNDEPLAEHKIRDFAFIEVTTRSGRGATTTYTPGTFLYKPLALSWPHQFYKPRYTVTDTAKKIDLRSTIDWEPNIITDASGEATVSFFAGTESSSYTIVIEGTDGNGNIGSQRKTIGITGNREVSKSK